MLLSIIGFLVGCASAPPPRALLDARAAYRKAQSGNAATLVPDELYEAKVALNDAEIEYNDSPGSENSFVLAYVAQRKAQIAQARADIKDAEERKRKAGVEILQLQAEGLQMAGERLSKARQDLATKGQELVAERKARDDAENRAREALEKVAAALALSVKQEERGTVIVFPGNVLFESGKSMLLANAQQKIGLLAEQLKNQGQEGAKITVEGHTDSRGTPDSNMTLSQARADAVRNYLVSMGVPSQNIMAVGVGEMRPIADNGTAEGRALNRRVEIIVKAGETR
jgi:outer membrane protein OmpA-like peptidoglycan-associated protein